MSMSPSTEDQIDAMNEKSQNRRRMLLKGLGKGSAVIAASIPIQTLATKVYVCGPDGNRQCSRSGINSAAHSFGPGIDKTPAKGRGPSYWGQKKDKYVRGNNVGQPVNAWPAGCDYATAKFSTVFGVNPATGTANTTLWDVVKAGSNFSTSSKSWVCAHLNALAFHPGSYPYSTAEIKALLNPSSSTMRGISSGGTSEDFVLFLQGNLEQSSS